MRRSISLYHSQSASDFRQDITASGITLAQEVTDTSFQPNGIYVSPETKNTYFEYSSGETEDFRFEQFVTGYYQDLVLTTEYFAAVFVVELPQPTVPVYINSRTSFNFNSILQLQSLPVLKGVEKVTLEGDFSEFFTVYSRTKHGLDAFMTVVPNLMVDMLISGSQYDVEFAGRYVYFYRLYSPTSAGNSNDSSCQISFSAKDYMAMRQFGIKYGTKFARASQHSTGDTVDDVRPLWQLVNDSQGANNARQIVWLIGILVYMLLFVALWYVVIPLTLIMLVMRFAQWTIRKKRLIARWSGRA